MTEEDRLSGPRDSAAGCLWGCMAKLFAFTYMSAVAISVMVAVLIMLAESQPKATIVTSQAELDALAPDSPVVAAGRIAPDTPADETGFVMRVTERLDPDDEDEDWDVAERAVPAFVLELEGGPVQVQEGYRIDRVSMENRIRPDPQTRITGLRADSLVTIRGLVAGEPPRTIDAALVRPGDAATQLAQGESGLRAFLVPAAILAGGLFLLLLRFGWRRMTGDTD